MASSFPQSTDKVKELFGVEPARRAGRAFRHFDVHEGNETSILSISRLDSIMATIIDLFIEEQVMEPAPASTQQNETSNTERVGAIYENTVAQHKVYL